ncbi:MAG TPA: Calx-beta domain-containing protein, partial [Chryseolinea sp.]|nr:Calx-beta domain-containing protein [Chryseolinea sp.]
MQKFTLLICSLGTLAVLGIGLSSCKDDEPFVKPNLSVSTETISVNENAGTAQVEFVLDGGAPENLTIEYSLGGTAISPADYTIVGTEGEVEIASGQTSAVVQIQIVNDAVYEGNETIEISIEDVSSVNVLVSNDDESVVTITDDDPQVNASFTATTLTVNEEDGLSEDYLKIEVKLSVAASSDITIQYDLAGTALDTLTGFNEEIPSDFYDYYIHGVSGELVIPSGQTSGNIEIQLYTDLNFEPTDETIIMTLAEATGGVTIGTNKEITITLKQQDGTVLGLLWDPSYTDVDMDMFLWLGPDITDLEIIYLAAAARTTPQQELIFIPKSLFPNAAFGLSYIYYEGTKEPMNFEVQFADYAAGVVEPLANRNVFTGAYALVNRNKWNDETLGTDPIIAQT